MRTKLIVTLIVLLVTGLLLVGCGTPEPTATPVPPTPAGPVELTVTGKVSQELSLTMDDLKAFGVEEITAEHPKKGTQTNEGVRLNKMLDEAGVESGAATFIITADDGYSAEVPLADVQACPDCHLKFGTEGGLSAVMPGMATNTWVKGVVTIEIK